MESTIVIKVKYEKTLRRFNACIDEAGKLKLSFNGLQEKVLSLFSLSPEVDLTLTYVDEDGDSVTLADDEDLIDVMRQSLNPLRIKAKVITEKGSTNSSARSSETPTPIRSSPGLFQPLPDLNATVSEIFKAVPEPIGEALSKLSHDLASKAAASNPQLPELVQHFSKMLQSYIAPVSDSQVGKEPEVSGGDGAKPKAGFDPNLFGSVKKADPTNGPPKDTFIAPVPSPFAVDAGQLSHGKEQVKKSAERSFLQAKAVKKPDWENIKAVASSVIETDDMDVATHTFWNQNDAQKMANFGAGTLNQNIIGQCPFAGTPVANEPPVPYTNFAPRVHPFRRSFSQGGVAGTFHRGVCCDGCGVHPITGPRFKSKVKEDYDLCSICFAEMGSSEAEYIRLDHPVPTSRHPRHFKGLYDFNARVGPPNLPQALRAVVKPKPKLDSRFIVDVNVTDGTMMAPSTPFTKIWRMRNNGTLAWPHHSQLVWIGGDRCGALPTATLQIPENGLSVDNELEVAVDFTAPKLPGRYVSYWKMATPSGQKFGQRVWVLIQVDASVKDSANSNIWQRLNLNLPPESSYLNEAEHVEPINVNALLPIPEPSNINVENITVNGRVPNYKSTDLVEPLVVPVPNKDQDLDFPINDNLLVSGTTVSYPTIDSSAVPMVVASLPPQTPPAVAESSAQASGEDYNDIEQILLRDLDSMGFKQVDLNKEILRMNEYNLEQSVDALCGVSEWDPILEELQEMGFCDNEVNKKLLKKNNGSIKGVVMDLINGQKA